MKRASFHQKTGVYINVEASRWQEFIDKCDRERKTVSLKLNELIVEDLQKNSLGVRAGPEPDPLMLSRYKSSNKRFQSRRLDPLQQTLDPWRFRKDIPELLKQHPDLSTHDYESYALGFGYAYYLKQGIAVDGGLKIVKYGR